MERVAIVGAGLSGLASAIRLRGSGLEARVFEANDDVGGRVRTSRIDGFLVDRGFQVLQTAYPEAYRLLDYESLDLRPFAPGALIRSGGRFLTMADPWRRPSKALAALCNGVGTLRDRWKLASLRNRTAKSAPESLWAGGDEPTATHLRETLGFSDDLVQRFMRPWFAGVFLEPDLETSSRFFEFTFKMFATGDAAVPAEGMQAIPRQLASRLSEEAISLNRSVTELDGTTLRFGDGEHERFDAVIVATEAPIARRLLGDAVPERASRGTTCFAFAAERPPIDEPMLILNGDGDGPVNNCCVPSNVASSYAPAGAALVSASVVGPPPEDLAALERGVRGQLQTWFGAAVADWRTLHVDAIPHALPSQPPGLLDGGPRDLKVRDGVYCGGDHRHTASINGAMLAGRLAAEALLADLGRDESGST